MTFTSNLLNDIKPQIFGTGIKEDKLEKEIINDKNKMDIEEQQILNLERNDSLENEEHIILNIIDQSKEKSLFEIKL